MNTVWIVMPILIVLMMNVILLIYVFVVKRSGKAVA